MIIPDMPAMCQFVYDLYGSSVEMMMQSLPVSTTYFSVVCSTTHSVYYSPTLTLTQSVIHLLTQHFAHSLTRSVTHSLCHSLIHSVTYSLCSFDATLQPTLNKQQEVKT